jgi:DNA-binding transcriptional regulator PaaX
LAWLWGEVDKNDAGAHDSRWRLIIYDIPEERRRQRQLLRKTLLHYGYGLWQKSVYLTPHPVMEVVTAWLRKHNLLSTVVCLESTKVGGLRDSELAREVFCNKQRLDMWRALEDSTFSIEKGKGKLWMRRLEELLIHDPWLPRELEDPYIFKVREKLVKRVANTFS